MESAFLFNRNSRLALRESSVVSRTITVTFAEPADAGNDRVCDGAAATFHL